MTIITDCKILDIAHPFKTWDGNIHTSKIIDFARRIEAAVLEELGKEGSVAIVDHGVLNWIADRQIDEGLLFLHHIPKQEPSQSEVDRMVASQNGDELPAPLGMARNDPDEVCPIQ